MIVSPAKTAEPIEMLLGIWSWVCPGNHVFDGSAHWRHMANTIEPSMCGGAAALCQVTLTICSNFRHNCVITNIQLLLSVVDHWLISGILGYATLIHL